MFEELAGCSGIVSNACSTQLTMPASREHLEALEAGEPLVGARVASPTMLFHVANAACTTDDNYEQRESCLQRACGDVCR